ncbi:hypothetical protein cypCar_00002519 [Cyprinus carpio]|nr:hypothetical protein cypCar_00002519 [Cyprinus carpio]
MSAPGAEGSGSAGMSGSNRKLQHTQAQVDEMWAILIAVVLVIIIVIIIWTQS